MSKTRVRFKRDFDHVTPAETVAYAAGLEDEVPTEHAERAIAAGAAEAVGSPAPAKADKTDSAR